MKKSLKYFFSYGLGALSVLSFAPFEQAWLIIPILSLSIALWSGLQARSAFIAGWSFGLGQMSWGIFWLHHSLAQFSPMPLWAAIGLTLLFAALMAVFFGFLVWSVQILPLSRKQRLLAYPAAWVLMEILRAFSGFPWLSLGYSQTQGPLFAYAPLIGVYGISFLILLLAASLLIKRGVLLLIAVMVLGWSLERIHWTQPQGQLSVRLVQPNTDQAQKWQPEHFNAIIASLLEPTLNSEAQLILWPETAVPAFAYAVRQSLLKPLAQHLQARQQDLILGIPMEKEGGFYNALLQIGYSGEQVYFKRHLVPFGEYIPGEDWLAPLLQAWRLPMSQFSAGKQMPLFQVQGHALGPSICYEIVFPALILDSLPQAALLINASNDAWFGDSLGPYQHLQMAQMRARESGRYLLRVTNTGISAIIDERGQLLFHLPLNQADVLDAMIPLYQGSTPFISAPWAMLSITLFWLSGGLVQSVFSFYRR